MRIPKECQVCDTKFTAIKTNQFFCTRKCFKRAYNVRKREERRKERETNPARFGYYTCTAPWCNEKSVIEYSVKRYPKKWAQHICPECNTPRLLNAENPRDLWYWESANWRGEIPYIVQAATRTVQGIVQTFVSTVVRF